MDASQGHASPRGYVFNESADSDVPHEYILESHVKIARLCIIYMNYVVSIVTAVAYNVSLPLTQLLYYC